MRSPFPIYSYLQNHLQRVSDSAVCTLNFQQPHHELALGVLIQLDFQYLGIDRQSRG